MEVQKAVTLRLSPYAAHPPEGDAYPTFSLPDAAHPPRGTHHTDGAGWELLWSPLREIAFSPSGCIIGTSPLLPRILK